MSNTSVAHRFNHSKDITIGVGRIVYVESRGVLGESTGWALPGRKFTQDSFEAIAMAQLINDNARRAAHAEALARSRR